MTYSDVTLGMNQKLQSGEQKVLGVRWNMACVQSPRDCQTGTEVAFHKEKSNWQVL